jgi:hypothetical protein
VAAQGCESDLVKALQFRRHQRPGAGDFREARDAVRRRLGAVRSAERVVDVDVAQRGDLFRQTFVVRLLAPC